MDIREITENVIKNVKKKGCDEAEVFVKKSQGISVEAKNGEVEALESSRSLGLALKVIKNKKMGFAFTTELKDINKTIAEAVESAQYTAEDEFIDIPEGNPENEVLIFDDQIRNIKEDSVIKDALLLEESALNFDKRITKVRKAGINAGLGETLIINSKGIYVRYESSYYSAQVTAIAEGTNGDNQMGWDYDGSRRKQDISISSVGAGAARNAIDLLGSRKIHPSKVPVILDRNVSVDFLDILSASLSAEAVQKKRSFLENKIGQAIVSKLLDVIDDGSLDWKTGTRPVDDEGVPTETKSLITNGTLQGYLHNTYSAKKDGVQSTGNAVRRDAKSIPGIGVSNLFIRKVGDTTKEDFIRSLKRGIVVRNAMGVHTANPISGDFSVGISGILIENGAAAYPIKEAVISGNILEMFKKVEGVGGDLRFYGNIGSPSLLIGEMDISA